MTVSTLSVIIPVYNSERTLTTAIDSVLMQRCDEVEIVVVDDGSSDASWEIIESYGERIVAIRQENSGANTARNLGIRVSSGSYIKFLDSDDFLLPESIPAQIAHMASLPEGAILYGSTLLWWEEAGGMSLHPARQAEVDLPEHIEYTISSNPLIAALLYPRSVLEKVHGFNEQVTIFQDFDILCRCIISGARVFSSRMPIFTYRLHQTPGRISKQRSAQSAWATYEVYKSLADMLDSSLPYYKKEDIARGLARHGWRRARDMLRDGHEEPASAIFDLMQQLDSSIRVGNTPYRVLAKAFGPVKAERLATSLKGHLSLRKIDGAQ